jgi:hypothetical protein
MSKIKAKILDQTDREVWDKFIEYSPWTDVFQTWEWGELQKKESSKPLRIAVTKDGFIILVVQILIKNISVLGSYGSVIHGPVFTSTEHLKESLPVLVNFLSNLTKNYNLAFLEIEPVFGDFGEVLQTSEKENSGQNNLTVYDEHILDKFGSLVKLDQKQFLKIFLENGFIQPLPATYKQEKKWYLELSKESLSIPNHSWKIQNYELSDPFVAKISKHIKLKLAEKNVYSEGLLEAGLFEKFIDNFKSKEGLQLWIACEENTVLALNLNMTSKFWSGSLFSLAIGNEQKDRQVLTDLQLFVIDQVKQDGGQIFDLGISDKHHQSLKKLPNYLEKTIRINTSGNLLLPISPLKYSLWDTYHWLKSDGKKDLQKISNQTLVATQKTSSQIWKETKKQSLVIWQKTKQEIDKLREKINSQMQDNNQKTTIKSEEKTLDVEIEINQKQQELSDSTPETVSPFSSKNYDNLIASKKDLKNEVSTGEFSANKALDESSKL